MRYLAHDCSHDLLGSTTTHHFISHQLQGDHIIKVANKVPLKQRHIQKHATEFRKMMENGEMHVHEVIQRFLSNDDCSTIISSNSHTSSKVLRFIKLKRVKNVTVQDFSPKLVPIAFEAKLAVMISDALTPEECEELMRRGKDTGYEEVLIRKDGMKSTQHIAKCHRANVKDYDLADELFQRVMGELHEVKYARWVLLEALISNAPITFPSSCTYRCT